MKKLMLFLLPLLLLCSCAPDTAEKPEPTAAAAAQTQPPEEPTLILSINSTPAAVKWEENESVAALAELVKNGPLTIRMSMYGGFEQVGPIGQSLPRNDEKITTEPGDIVLYSGDQIVLFYGSNSWAYTRLGHIIGRTQQELKELLANGDVEITISRQIQ